MKKIFLTLLTFCFFNSFAQATVYQINCDRTDISVKKGDKVTIVLEENPTTGYSWNFSIVNFEHEVIKQTQKEFVPPSDKLIGAGGLVKYTIKIVKAGNAQVKATYNRSWDISDCAQTYTLNIYSRK